MYPIVGETCVYFSLVYVLYVHYYYGVVRLILEYFDDVYINTWDVLILFGVLLILIVY